VSKEVKSFVHKALKQEERKMVEPKNFPFSSSGPQAINSGGSVLCLSGVPQGVGDHSRVGDQIKPRSLELTFFLQFNAAGTAFPVQQSRIMIVSWKPSVTALGGTIPSAANFLEALFVGTSQAPQSMLNWDYRQEYRVHYDSIFASANDADTQGITRKLNLKYTHNLNFSYQTTQSTNHLFILYIGDQSVAGNEQTIEYIGRLIYEDS